MGSTMLYSYGSAPIRLDKIQPGYSYWSLPDKYNVYSGWHLEKTDTTMKSVLSNTLSPLNTDDMVSLCINFQQRPPMKSGMDKVLEHKWLPIPWANLDHRVSIPFGYKYDPEDEIFKEFPELDPKGCLVPIPLELVAMEKAKRLLKEYAKDTVREWLVRVTGREITPYAFEKRITQDHERDRRAKFLRKTALKLARALEQAIVLESRYLGAGKALGYTIWGDAIDGKFDPKRTEDPELEVLRGNDG